jgi:HD domain-containing protein
VITEVTYYALIGSTGDITNPHNISREVRGKRGHFVERLDLEDPSRWIHDSGLGRYIFLGEPGAEQITEAQARKFVESRGGDFSPPDPAPITSRIEDAFRYAVRVHAKQRRLGAGTPYIAHPLAVCSLVLEAGGDDDQAIAALLHDVAEDHGGRERLRDVCDRFGERVAAIVEGCSDALDEPKPPWRLRKEGYLEHLREASDDVLLVCLADKLHNARSVLMDYRQYGDALWRRFSGGRDYAAWYLTELARLFRDRRPGALAEELDRVVRETVTRMPPHGPIDTPRTPPYTG